MTNPHTTTPVILAVLLLISACAPSQTSFPVSASVPQASPNEWEQELKKQDADLQAQHRYQRAYIECQEYEFNLQGCDVIKRKRDTDERAALISAAQQHKAEKEAAEKMVSDEAAELSKP
jgi:hypothetical protein